MGSNFVQRLGLIVPPCKDACPAGVDAARYIREIKLGRPGQSLAVIRERIPFPAVCDDPSADLGRHAVAF